MNKRDTAIADGKVKYNSGKPCKAGHTSDRYASNGMCVQCLDIQAEARRGVARVAKIKRNNALFSSMHERIYMVRNGDKDILEKMGEVLQYSPQAVIDQCRTFVEALYKHAPIPRNLTRADLMEFMDYRDNIVHNYTSLETSTVTDDNPILYMIHKGNRYVGDEVMEVLRGLRLTANPK